MSSAPEPSTASTDPLDEVRARLDGLADVPIGAHPDEFSAIDSLLRHALDATGASPGR